jgi:hypothetical protein
MGLSMVVRFRQRGMVGGRSDQCSPAVAIGPGRHAEHGRSSGRQSQGKTVSGADRRQ